MSSIYTYNGKILQRNNAIANDPSCCCCVYMLDFSTPWTLIGKGAQNEYATWEKRNVLVKIKNGDPAPQNMQVDAYISGFVYQPSAPPIPLELATIVTAPDPTQPLVLRGTSNIGNAPVIVYTLELSRELSPVTLISYDIDGQNGTNVKDFWGVDPTAGGEFDTPKVLEDGEYLKIGNQLGRSVYLAGGSLPGDFKTAIYKNVGTNIDYDPNSIIIPETQKPYTAAVFYKKFKKGKFIFGFADDQEEGVFKPQTRAAALMGYICGEEDGLVA
jgi:hypothetical protein